MSNRLTAMGNASALKKDERMHKVRILFDKDIPRYQTTNGLQEGMLKEFGESLSVTTIRKYVTEMNLRVFDSQSKVVIDGRPPKSKI